MSRIIDIDGRPVSSEPEPLVDDELPPWIEGIAYSADARTITMRCLVPFDRGGGVVLVAFEATPNEIASIVAALTRCLDAWRAHHSMLDVPARPSE